MNDNLKIYTAQEIWASVEYGNGMHKGDHNFVQLEDYQELENRLNNLANKVEEIVWKML